jgi:hypothetical protein
MENLTWRKFVFGYYGRYYGAIYTAMRYLVSRFSKNAKCTIFFLGDWNPDGLGIFLCYLIGTYSLECIVKDKNRSMSFFVI